MADVTILPAELDDHGAVCCPNPKMPLWSTHPRVFFDLARNGRAKCPYCSTVYVLQGGAVDVGH